jgi:hypothetical protein
MSEDSYMLKQKSLNGSNVKKKKHTKYTRVKVKEIGKDVRGK